MNKLLKKNNRSLKTLEAFCYCNCSSCYCRTARITASNYTTVGTNRYKSSNQ